MSYNNYLVDFQVYKPRELIVNPKRGVDEVAQIIGIVGTQKQEDVYLSITGQREILKQEETTHFHLRERD